MPALLLLAGCATSPALEDLIADDPIDIPRLEEELRLEPGWIRVVPPTLPPLSFAPTPGPWGVVNVGPRPVWIHLPSVKLDVEFTPFLEHGERPWGARHGLRRLLNEPPPPRPSIVPAEWIRLEPGERRDFVAEPARAAEEWFRARLVKGDGPGRIPGTYRTTFTLADGGGRLLHEARDYLAGKRLPWEGAVTISAPAVQEFVLPRFDSPGSPWHGDHPIAPRPLDARRLEFIGTHTDTEWVKEVRPDLPLEAFVVRDGVLVFRGPLSVESATLVDPAHTRIVYRLPDSLKPGSCRILVRTADAKGFFLPGPVMHKCDAPDGAASAWIDVDVRD